MQHLALSARPALALRPQRGQARRDLHADQSAWLVRRLPTGHQQPPGEVDVLGRHPPVVAADRPHPIAAEHPEHAGNDADPAGERLGAPDQPDDRRGFENLHRAEQPIAIGDMRRARHRRQHRRGLDPRHEKPDGVRVHVRVGVGDHHQLMPGALEPGVELLGLATVDGVTQHAQASIAARRLDRRRLGVVGGAVIEDEHLELRVVGPQRRPHAGRDHGFLVVRGNQDAHTGPAALRLQERIARAFLPQPEHEAAGDPQRRGGHGVQRDDCQQHVKRGLHTGAPRGVARAGAG